MSFVEQTSTKRISLKLPPLTSVKWSFVETSLATITLVQNRAAPAMFTVPVSYKSAAGWIHTNSHWIFVLNSITAKKSWQNDVKNDINGKYHASNHGEEKCTWI